MNHEANEVVTKAFSKAFSAHCAIPTTFFNYERDTLLLRLDDKTGTFLLLQSENNFLEEVLSRMVLAERSLVKHVCVDLRLCQDGDNISYMWLGWCLVMFPNCKTFSFELPNTEMVLEEAGEGLLFGEAVQAKRELWVQSFEIYRRHGTVVYEVAEWKQYVRSVHGVKGLVVRECRVDGLVEDGECEGECISMI